MQLSYGIHCALENGTLQTGELDLLANKVDAGAAGSVHTGELGNAMES